MVDDVPVFRELVVLARRRVRKTLSSLLIYARTWQRKQCPRVTFTEVTLSNYGEKAWFGGGDCYLLIYLITSG